MRKPVSLAPAGRSLTEAPPNVAPSAPVSPVEGQANVQPKADREIARDIGVAAQVAEAAVDAPVAAVASDLGQTFLDYWARQADSFWSHGLTLANARTMSDVIEAQGHFVRQQVEIARAQSATLSSLLNQSLGVSMIDRLPAMQAWAPWQTTICKPGG